jgi:hypothetical protein
LSSGADLCDILASRRWVLEIIVGCYFIFLEYWENTEFSKHCVFLGDFEKFKKSAISFVMSFRVSVRPIARMEKLDYHFRGFS